jgi:DNA-binding response OmpR family regulator
MAVKNVLIVEDERPLAHALELKLKHEGINVELAHNGKDGIDLAKAKEFDLVLLDMMMPVMDGFAVLKELATLPRVPQVFVLSNLSQHEDESKVISAGAKKYFVKSDTPLSVIVEEIKKL